MSNDPLFLLDDADATVPIEQLKSSSPLRFFKNGGKQHDRCSNLVIKVAITGLLILSAGLVAFLIYLLVNF